MKWKNWPYWLKGGIIGLALGYIGYLIVYYYYRYRIVTLYKAGTTPEDLSLIGSIPGIEWFIIYSLFSFGVGALIGLIIQKIKAKK